MWPWEHLAVGYLAYSLGGRVLGRAPPGERETIVVVLATQLPDLVDKPLSWGLGWFPSGFAIAHSGFVAVPLGVLSIALARHVDRPRFGVGFTVGYWSHLVADVFNPIRTGEGPLVGRVLWPIAETTPYETDYGLARGIVYIQELLTGFPTMNPVEIVLLYLVLPAVAVVLWVLDGSPGVSIVKRAIATCRRHVP